MSHNKISDIIESICTEGCTSVNSIIKALEQGEMTIQTESLTVAERIQLIKELKEIMSVYDNR